MSVDFSKITELSDSYGNITQITDASGRVIWKQAPKEATVTIGGAGSTTYAYVSIDGAKYTSGTVVVPIGTVIYCYTQTTREDYGSISVNGTTVASTNNYVGGKTPYYYAEYNYTVNRNIQISLYGNNGTYSQNYVEITEQ